MLQIIGGTLKKKKLKSPKGLKTRPTSSRLREALFNICQHKIEGARFLDLFAGSGAMGIEALSRGAEMALFIDNDRESTQCIRANLKDLNLVENSRVVMENVIATLPKLGTYDIIYVDPPYIEKNDEMPYSAQVLTCVDQSELLAPGGMLFIEDSKAWDPDFESLHFLQLRSSRKIGRSMLHQFVKTMR